MPLLQWLCLVASFPGRFETDVEKRRPGYKTMCLAAEDCLHSVFLTECPDEGWVTLASQSGSQWQDGTYGEDVREPESHSSIVTPVHQVLLIVCLFL